MINAMTPFSTALPLKDKKYHAIIHVSLFTYHIKQCKQYTHTLYNYMKFFLALM